VKALQDLIAELLATNAFYGRKLRAAGITAPPATMEEFYQYPFTTKKELVEDQLAYPPYGTNLTYPLERYSRFYQTSGTSGVPMRWLDTPESHEWMIQNWLRVYAGAGVTAADRIFFAFSFGPFLGFWTAFDSATRLGSLAIPGGGMRSAQRLAVMIDNAATVLCCTPTYALHLAEVAAEENIDLTRSSIRVIITAGEPGASIPATRALLESKWNGARIYDHHGMTEVGPASYECPKRPGVLHMIEPSFISEVIDEELILTNIGRTASPLLRYRTGDLVKPSKEKTCICGSKELALEGGILGRIDDMITVRGVNVYPGAVEQILRSFPDITEYKVELKTIKGLAEMTVEIETNNAALAHEVDQALNKALGLRVPVTLVAPGTLPRFEMKARRWNILPQR